MDSSTVSFLVPQVFAERFFAFFELHNNQLKLGDEARFVACCFHLQDVDKYIDARKMRNRESHRNKSVRNLHGDH